MRNPVALFLLALGIALSEFPVTAQSVPPVPNVVVSPSMPVTRAGHAASLNIKLLNSLGAPTPASKNLRFDLAVEGAKLDRKWIVIPKGQSEAHVNVVRDTPGISVLTVKPAEPLLHVSAVVATHAQVAFSAASAYKPLLPLSLLLNITPTILRAGVDTAEVTAIVVDRTRTPVPAPHVLDVSFPGLGDFFKPDRIRITAGSADVEATLATAPGTPSTRPFMPVVNPTLTVVSNTSEIQFVSPIVGLRILTDPSYIKAISLARGKTSVKVGFVDGKGNWISAQSDRTVILRLDPPEAGRLQPSELTISKGSLTAQTTLIPYEEGISTVSADPIPGLSIQAAKFEFRYAFIVFLIFAALGGIAGGFVRELLPSNRPTRSYVRGLLAGAVLGILAYLLAPALVTISLKPEAFQNGSKLFEAFLWGFLGGGGGAALFAKLLPLTQSAAP